MSDIKNRNSALQKDILFVFLHIRERNDTLLPFTKLHFILNSGRSQDVQKSNLRTSCQTLVKRGLLLKYRDKIALTVAYRLSSTGVDEAIKIREEREK